MSADNNIRMEWITSVGGNDDLLYKYPHYDNRYGSFMRRRCNKYIPDLYSFSLGDYLQPNMMTINMYDLNFFTI